MPESNRKQDHPSPKHTTSASINWYAEGQESVVEVGGVRFTVRYIGRKGRRARIVITAPAGAVFRSEVS